MNRRGFLASTAALLVGGRALAEDDPEDQSTPEKRKLYRDRALQTELDYQRLMAADVLARKDPLLQNFYQPNVSVYSACVQNRVSFSIQDKGEMTRRVFKHFDAKHNPVKSLYEAVNAERAGWINPDEHHVNVQAPVIRRGDTDGWRVDDNARVKNGDLNRYVVLLTGEGKTDKKHKDWKAEEETSFTNDAKKVREVAAETFLVPNDDAHILQLDARSPAEIRKALKNWLSPKQAKNAELLFFYSGHGGVEYEYTKLRRRQGAGEGLMYTLLENPVRETELKQWLKKFAKQFNHVAIFLDACHSGSFVAQNDRARLNRIA